MAVAACCCTRSAVVTCRFTMAVALVLAVLCSSSLFLVPSTAELQRLQHPLKSDGSLSLLVVGDWGRRGEYNQSLVAHQMGITGEELDIDFVISTGDNFYDNGLSSVNDEAFQESFTNIYTAKSLQKPWYTVLGNHDYEGDALAQLNPILRKFDSRWVCIRSFILDAEIVEFFFVDTTPFVKTYWKKPPKHIYDWRGVAPREQYITNLLKDVDTALQESSTRWKIVVGHHTIRSVSTHGDTHELKSTLLPILERNGVDFYINGHDHCLEHISSTDSKLQFLTSGGGSKAWRGVLNPTDDLRFFYDGQGFMSLHVTNDAVEFVFYDAFGRVLETGSISKGLDFAI